MFFEEPNKLNVGDKFMLELGGMGMGPDDHNYVYRVVSVSPDKIEIARCERIASNPVVKE